jgi:acyl-CoA synthetase (AMP-forming)/AMP-acid ligase II
MSGPSPAAPPAHDGSTASAPADALRAALAAAALCSDRGVRLADRREQDRLLPWSELLARAADTGGSLQALGVAPGVGVALCFPTGEEVLVALFGCWLAGAVPVVVPPPLRLGEPVEQRRRVGAALARSRADLLLTAATLLPALRDASALRLGCHALDALPPGPLAEVALAPGARGLVQLSSGSTGEPKAVALARDALVGQARLLNSLWPDRDDWRASGASWLPLHHDMGLVGCVLPALERRTDLTLLAPEAFVARPALWLRAIARSGATVSPAPTFGYAHCLRRVRDEELAGVDLSRWRHALCGAEPVTPEVLRGFAARFARWGFRAEALTAVYGLAEAGLAVTFAALDRPFTSARFDRAALRRGEAVTSPRASEAAGANEEHELVSLGPPLPGFALEVRDGTGTPLPERRVGRVWLRGPTLMQGYLGDPAATAVAQRGGWLDSGDLGFLQDGELFLVGRAKDVVIVRGSNFAAEEVEAAALAGEATPRPGAVAAVGLPAGAGEEELVLLVEREAGDDATADRLAARCRESVLRVLSVHASRVVVVAAGTLPRTSSGKLRRAEALRRLRDGELIGEEPGGPASGRRATAATASSTPGRPAGAAARRR